MNRRFPILAPLAVLAAILLATACSSDSGPSPGNPDGDYDGDGFTPNQGDCDDLSVTAYPGAPESCDGMDQDCDNTIDEDFDADKDGYTSCGGDCRDNDATSNPGTSEILDGFDNDCDGLVDNNTTQYDDDGDGYSEDQGDCNDDPDGDGPFVGPGAIEVQLNEDGDPENLDNDCDGQVDEALLPCPSERSVSDPYSYAHATDVCEQLAGASWSSSVGIAADSRAYATTFGQAYTPLAGPDMLVLSTGLAGDSSLPGFVSPGSGTPFGNSTSHPSPEGDPADGCGVADPLTVNDYSELRLVLNVPTNANGVSFDFNFLSGEFPTYVCSDFDDTFLAILESDAFSGNVSFDENGNRVSINIGFFDVCSPALAGSCQGEGDLAGTGYESHGGTGWLTTTAPVIGGEKAILTFMIFDEGDEILDSTVLIDNLRWEIKEVEGPITVDRLPQFDTTRFGRDALDAPVLN